MDTTFQQKNVVITGGSSGIGYATAQAFAKVGANLILIARDATKLDTKAKELKQQFPNINVHTFAVDVSNRAEITATIERIGAMPGGIHTLISNAGISLCKRFDESSIEEIEEVLNINFNGTLYLVKAAWPFLKAQKGAHLGIVSSVAGYTGVYGYTAYAPSKFALAGFAESLRPEAIDCDISLSIIYPPDTDTPLLHYERKTMPPETLAINSSASLMTSEAVANLLLKGMQKNKFEIICNFESKGIRILKSIAPRLYASIMDGIIKKDRKKRAN